MNGPFCKKEISPPTSIKVAHMNDYRFIPVPAESVPMWWGRIERLYLDTPETWADYEKLEHIYEQHLSGHRILYVTLNGMELEFAISGKVQVWPQGRVVHLDWCAGKNVKDYIGLALSSLETMAWQVNAFEVQFCGREGWRKLLEPFGYRVTHVTYTKRLIGTRSS
jgi:hypothetical protein